MWPFRQFREGNPNDLFRELAAASVGDRTPMDVYRDFRAVFLGTEQGKRVLNDILTWCHLGHSSIKPGPVDPYAVMASEGERRIGLRIQTVMSAEPTAKPKQQNR